jgi:phage terminase large subunit
MENKIRLPHNFEPRDYQIPLLSALDHGYKRAVAIWHRRAGKDLVMLNYICKSMYERVGTYYYFFPTYRQAKKVIWNGMTRDGFKFIDYFPKQLRKRTNDSEMLIEMENGSIFQLIGTDNIDAVMGANPVGCVFSEWSLQNPAAWDYTRPILAENDGWGAFIYTPRGKNHGHTLLETARAYPDTWYSEVLTVEDTKAINPDVLNQEYDEIVRKDGNDSLYRQEYMCDFEVPIQGAYYAAQLLLAEQEGRITGVPYDHNVPVHTAWDLGMDDSMSIWFFQIANQEVHFINYYESSGEGINYYIKYLQDKGYIYGRHFAPHDIAVRELGTGKSRLEVARSLGINFEVGKKLSVEDGIQAVRNVLPRCWFDKEKCDRGISALRSYHKEWDEDNQVFKQRPEHDWSSHGSDSFRCFAVGYRELVTLPPATHVKVNDDPYQRSFGNKTDFEGGVL